ncbi:MAG: hypothetical protein ACOC7M_02120 [Chloroflexota bacterium]
MKKGLVFPAVRSLGVVLLAGLLFVASPGIAVGHAPAGVEESSDVELEPIVVRDAGGQGEEVDLDTVKELHGHLCICGVAAFRAARVGLSQLYGDDEIPSRGEVDVVYFHPGKGHRQVMEYLFGVDHVTIEKLHPQHLNTENFTYQFTRSSTGESFEVKLAEDIVPQEFTDLRYAVKGFENGWHDEEPPREAANEFAAVYSEVLDRFIQSPDWVLYEGIEEPAEPAPVGDMAFSAAVVMLLGAGFVYSVRSQRRYP